MRLHETFQNEKSFSRQILTLTLILCSLLHSSSSIITVLGDQICRDIIDFTPNSITTNFPSESHTLSMSRDPKTSKEIKLDFEMLKSNPIKKFPGVCTEVSNGTILNKMKTTTSTSELQITYKYTASSLKSKNFDEIVVTAFLDVTSGSGDTKTLFDVYKDIKTNLNTSTDSSGLIMYIDTKKLYVIIPTIFGPYTAINEAGAQNTACPGTAATFKGESVFRSNCLVGGDLKDYFINQASYSIATWMLCLIICVFFILLILSSNIMNMDDDNLRNNRMTLHPIYSLWMTGTEQHTKISRLAQVFVELTINYFVCAIIVFHDTDNTDENLLGMGIGLGLVAGWIVTYFTGCLLKRARNTDKKYLEDRGSELSGENIRHLREEYERSKFVRYYEYYILCILIVLSIVIGKLFVSVSVLIVRLHGDALWN